VDGARAAPRLAESTVSTRRRIGSVAARVPRGLRRAVSSALVRPRAPKPLARLFLQEDLNFLITNRIPRRLATRAMASFSRIRSRRLTRVSLRVWQLFADDLRLDEAEQNEFESLHDCFTRRLKAGARPIDRDPDVIVSPCDAIVGAHGPVIGTRLIQ